MNVAATDSRDSAALAEKTPRESAASALLRRLRKAGDMAFVLGAWVASWAIVFLFARSLGALF